MRADLLMEICPYMIARDAVLVILQSDREVVLNRTGAGWGAIGRTLAQLKQFNKKISRDTLWRLQKEGWVEPVGLAWRLKLLSLPETPARE